MQELTLYNDDHGRLITNAGTVRDHLPELLRRFDYIIDDDNVKTAKADRALLNKFVKGLAEQRQKYEKQTYDPWLKAKAEIMEIEKTVKAKAKEMGAEINSLDDRRKKQRAEENKAYWDSLRTGIAYEAIADSSWLNKSESTKGIHEQMDALRERFNREWRLIAYEAKDAGLPEHAIRYLQKKFNADPKQDLTEEIRFLSDEEARQAVEIKAIKEAIDEAFPDELPDIDFNEEGEIETWHQLKCTEAEWKAVTEYLEDLRKR